MNRNSYTKRRTETINQIKLDLKDGKERTNKNQAIKLHGIIDKNRTDKFNLNKLQRLDILNQIHKNYFDSLKSQ